MTIEVKADNILKGCQTYEATKMEEVTESTGTFTPLKQQSFEDNQYSLMTVSF